MSDLKLYCPECGARLSVSENLAGQSVACPDCAARIPIPATPGCGALPIGTVLSLDLRFLCPCCEKKLAIDAEYAGTSLHCPKCTERIVVPHPAPHLLPVNPAAVRTESTVPPEQPAAALSEDEVAFLLAPE